MASASFVQTQRLLEVTTPLGEALVINGLSATEAVSSLFRYRLDLLAVSSATIDMKKLLGKPVAVSMVRDGQKRHFHGIAGRISSGPREQRFQHFQVEVVPWLWLLTHKSDSRIFQDKTVVEIVKEVFDELKHSFHEIYYRDATTKKHVPLDYCVQYRETDFNFVSRLMEQDGIFYFFEHAHDKHTLVLADANSVLISCPGKSSVLYAEGGIGEREGIVTHLEKDLELRPGKYTLRDHHFQLPGKSLEVSEAGKDGALPALEIYDYPGEYGLRFNNPEQRLDQVEKEGEKLVRIRMEEEELPAHVLSGISTCRSFASGYKFTLNKHFHSNGEYVLTSVSHSVKQSPDYISGTEAGGLGYQNNFVCVPADVPVRPRRATPKPVIAGPQTAIVAVKSSEESWLDKFGRVRIQFHWERKGKNNESSACWVRVAQPWAGAAWGAHFWPRVGQEVVVEFLEGDPDRPIITGSVYNKASMPPYELPHHYTRSGFISRSSKQGGSANFNELRFEDKKGQEQVFINAERDMDHRVEHDSRAWVGNDQHLIVKAKQTELIEGDKHEHVKAAHVEKVDGSASREVGADHKEKIGGKMSLQVGTAHHEKVGQLYVVETGQEIHLKSGMKIIIESGMQVSIKGAGGFVDIGPAGVTIQGMMVNINSGGSAGSGTSASPDAPDAPKDPEIADDGSKGGKLG